MKQIYPICLSEHTARKLCDQYCSKEFYEGTRYHPSYCPVDYTFYAYLQKNGEVEMRAHFSYDDGFCQSCGPVFCKTIQPFDAEHIAAIVDKEKFRLAKVAYDERKRKQEERAIRKLMGKMFPTKRRAREIHPLRQS